MKEYIGLIAAFTSVFFFKLTDVNMWIGFPIAFVIGILATKYEW